MTRTIRNVAIVVGSAVALAGCGGSNKTVTTTPPVVTPPAAVSFQSRFGTPFQTAFDASTTATPTKPAATDVPALSLTTEPLDN